MSKNEYESLTETEKLFIYKEYEHKFIDETTWLRNSVLNAISNALRKKSQKFIDLFPSKKKGRADLEYNQSSLENILEIEKKKGKGWVDKIYQKLGIKTPEKGGN